MDKNVVGGMEIIHEITDLIHVQQKLIESNEKLQEVLDLAKLGLWERDVISGVLNWPESIALSIFEMAVPKVLTFDDL